MDFPDRPFAGFRLPCMPLKFMALRAARGQLDEVEFRAALTDLVAFADADALRQEALQYPLLRRHCQPVLDEVEARLRSFRLLAGGLLERHPEAKGLKALERQRDVLRHILGILFVASERAMGPTPDGEVNVILRLAIGRCISPLRFRCRGYRDALRSGPRKSWMERHIAALGRVLEALRLWGKTDRADRTPDLLSAMEDLTRAAMLLPAYHGPPHCPKPPKREPISAIWRKNCCDFCISRVFPDWPWWWLWPTRELPQLSVNEMLAPYAKAVAGKH